MDLYSELAWVYELPDYKQSTVASTFDLWRSSNCLAGYPKWILSDRGDEFNLIDCPRLKTSANHPQTNGKLERFHQDLAVSSRVQKCSPVMAVKTMRTDMMVRRFREPLANLSDFRSPYRSPFDVTTLKGLSMLETMFFGIFRKD